MKLSTRGGEGEVAVEAKMKMRVEVHPAHDRWMMGDRFGTIDRVLDPVRVRVRLDRSGDAVWFDTKDLMPAK